MVWLCKDCKKEVEILASIDDGFFAKDAKPKEVVEEIRKEEVTIRCQECDGTDVEWKE